MTESGERHSTVALWLGKGTGMLGGWVGPIDGLKAT
jgi:hypothetical protein